MIFIICLTHTNVWESIGKPCSCIEFIKNIFYCKSRARENPYLYKSRDQGILYLYFMYCESRALRAMIKSFITTVATKLYRKQYHSFVLLLALLPVLRTHNNTDSNKLVVQLRTMVIIIIKCAEYASRRRISGNVQVDIVVTTCSL